MEYKLLIICCKHAYYGSVVRFIEGAVPVPACVNFVPGFTTVLKKPPFFRKKLFPVIPPMASIRWLLE